MKAHMPLPHVSPLGRGGGQVALNGESQSVPRHIRPEPRAHASEQLLSGLLMQLSHDTGQWRSAQISDGERINRSKFDEVGHTGLSKAC